MRFRFEDQFEFVVAAGLAWLLVAEGSIAQLVATGLVGSLVAAASFRASFSLPF